MRFGFSFNVKQGRRRSGGRDVGLLVGGIDNSRAASGRGVEAVRRMDRAGGRRPPGFLTRNPKAYEVPKECLAQLVGPGGDLHDPPRLDRGCVGDLPGHVTSLILYGELHIRGSGDPSLGAHRDRVRVQPAPGKGARIASSTAAQAVMVCGSAPPRRTTTTSPRSTSRRWTP